MPQGGQLSINLAAVDSVPYRELKSSEGDNGFVCIDVTDTGEGMHPEVAERVFEPFFSTKQAGGGTGLGLASVYGVIQQCEGSIRVESQVGEGTTFRIYLRRAEAPHRLVPVSPPTAPVILLVEKEALVRSSTSRLLQSAGYNVVEAIDVEAAALVLDARAVDLVITDVRMSGVEGEELARKVNLASRPVPVLFTSSFADAGPSMGGNVEFIRKPFPSDKLVQRVRRLVPLNRR